jgi:hypothetical protein
MLKFVSYTTGGHSAATKNAGRFRPGGHKIFEGINLAKLKWQYDSEKSYE